MAVRTYSRSSAAVDWVDMAVAAATYHRVFRRQQLPGREDTCVMRGARWVMVRKRRHVYEYFSALVARYFQRVSRGSIRTPCDYSGPDSVDFYPQLKRRRSRGDAESELYALLQEMGHRYNLHPSTSSSLESDWSHRWVDDYVYIDGEKYTFSDYVGSSYTKCRPALLAIRKLLDDISDL